MWLKAHQGYQKQHHIVRDEYYALPVCNTVQKTLCTFHYLDIKANSFQNTGIFPFWPVVFRDHDFALNHKDNESILQFDKNKHAHLLHRLTSLLVQISEAPAHLVHNVLQMFCLIGGRITVQTNCDSALRICLRKLLGRTVDRLLQRKDHGERRISRYHLVQVVRKGRKTIMMVTVMMKMCKVCTAINIFRRQEGEKWVHCRKCFHWYREICAADATVVSILNLCAVCWSC